jgi:hypothetical protein
MQDEDAKSGKSAAQNLAEVVARRKAAMATASDPLQGGRRQAERAAAARSASKSKPALRK